MNKEGLPSTCAKGELIDEKSSDTKSRLLSLSRFRGSKNKTAYNVSEKLEELPCEVVDEPCHTDTQGKHKHVAFNESIDAIDGVVNDCNDAVEVWTVYSPVAYVTRKEQWILQKQCAERARALRKACVSMFTTTCDVNKTNKAIETSPSFFQSSILRRNKSISEAVKLLSSSDFVNAGFGEYHLACMYFIISLCPAIPIDVRPPLTPLVETSMEALFKGTQLCIFNNVPQMPVCCTAALRLLRNGEGEEGCIAIYNLEGNSSLDAHIPLSLLHHLELGLQHSEVEHYVDDTKTIKCRVPSSTSTTTVMYAHSLTLHCELPQKFYISFVALNEQQFQQWVTVLEFFSLHNAKCAEYLRNNATKFIHDKEFSRGLIVKHPIIE